MYSFVAKYYHFFLGIPLLWSCQSAGAGERHMYDEAFTQTRTSYSTTHQGYDRVLSPLNQANAEEQSCHLKLFLFRPSILTLPD